MRRASVTASLVFLIAQTGTGEAADPRSQAEVEQMFPLPQHFKPFELFSARTVAKEGAAILASQLVDYPSMRLRNVKAVYQANWRSWDRDYYICGEIDTRNRMGGYTGWQYFVVSDNKSKPPDVFYGNMAAFMYQQFCNRTRADRFLSDTSSNYAKILMSAGR